MSHFSILRDATLEFRRTLFDALTNDPDVNFGFTDITTDIVLGAPNDSAPSSARLSLYMYHVELDPQMNNQPMLANGADELLMAPQAVRTFYLLTPLLNQEDQNHLMLGRILQTLHDRPFLNEIVGVPLGDSSGGGSSELRLSMEQIRLDDISRIWHAMGSDYRLSVAYMMRSLVIDSALDPRQSSRVQTSNVVVHQRG